MAWQWYDSELIKVEDLSPNTKLFTLKILEEDAWQFEAGQFITLDLPIGVKRRDGWRSYSIANAPDGTNLLELCIVRLEGGLGTRYLFEDAKVGTKITFKGPSGHFVLPEDPAAGVVAICTGTGIAPFRSMWQQAIDEGRSFHLIFGTRTHSDILFEEEMRELAKQHPNFKYTICLSREEREGYEYGYVHEVYMKDYAENQNGLVFYLCGWHKMVDQAVSNLLLSLKVDRKKIVYELFG